MFDIIFKVETTRTTTLPTDSFVPEWNVYSESSPFPPRPSPDGLLRPTSHGYRKGEGVRPKSGYQTSFLQGFEVKPSITGFGLLISRLRLVVKRSRSIVTTTDQLSWSNTAHLRWIIILNYHDPLRLIQDFRMDSFCFTTFENKTVKRKGTLEF